MKYPTSDEQYQIRDSKSHYTMIPNIVFDLGLSVYAVRLYCELKRVAGDSGACWMTTNTLSKNCNMSMGSVSSAKEELVKAHLINISESSRKTPGRPLHIIDIIDIWAENEKNFSQKYNQNSVTENQTSPGEVQTSCGEVQTSPGEINNIYINNIPKTRETKKEEYLKSIEKSVAIGMSRGGSGLESYPEDVRPVLLVFMKLWNIKLPRAGQKGYWINGARDLLDACGEMQAEVLYELRQDFERYMSSHGGVAPYTVATPQSLVNPARAKAGWMRDREKSKVPVDAAELWIGGVKVS